MKTNIIKISKSLQNLNSEIAEDSAIYNWIADIKKAFLINSNITDWNLVGKAVVLEAQEEDDVHDTLDLVAKTLNISLIKIEMPYLINNFKDWSNNMSYIQPAIIYLEPGIWHGDEFKDTSENSQYLDFEREELIKFRSNLIDLIRNKFQEKPLIIVTSVKEFAQLDISFRCEGLFDRRIEVPKWTDEKIFNQFISNIGKEKFSESILNNKTKVAALIRAIYPDKRRRLLTEKALKIKKEKLDKDIAAHKL